ncbi:alpha/beta hydrolase [Herbaspirillum sp. B65]|uniref:alpha/beta hydrolase n=1 Tax=Herbaspirillum sp. B65 TaxID=137708 RepID=UPI002090AF53|nr:hypothetical protein [Herbaspirillum sp. B65]
MTIIPDIDPILTMAPRPRASIAQPGEHLDDRHLGDVRTPTLIVHAAQDDVASRKSADLVEAKIGAQCRKKVILQNSYHMITLDNDKEIVAREIVDFLAVQRFKADVRPSQVSTVPRLRVMAG